MDWKLGGMGWDKIFGEDIEIFSLIYFIGSDVFTT